MNNTIKPTKEMPCVGFGGIASGFEDSMSYWEGIKYLERKINELISIFNNVITDKIDPYIDERFNEMMVDAIYDGETETLILKLTDTSVSE